MNFLVMALFVAIFLAGYLAQRLGVVPVYFMLVPELLTGIALLGVLLRVISGRRIVLDWRYVAFLGVFLFTLTAGFLAQSVPPGAIVSGLRNYVKFIPIFLLAAAYPFTARQLRAQLIVLLAVLAAQIPLSVYQRFVQFAHRMHTGDPIRGMATSSSALSLLMVCAIVLLVSLYFRSRIKLPYLLIAIALLMVPTTLNETKGTFVMLPVAMLAPAFFMPRGSRPFRKMVPIIAIGMVALVAFVAAYDRMITHRDGGVTIVEFFTEGRVNTYLYTGAAEGEDRYVGRFDSVAIAMKMISDDPLKLAFGYGAGNVSTSRSLPGFEGEYGIFFDRYGVGVTQVSNFLWEIGVVGMLAFLWLYWCVFRDARYLARTKGDFAIYGQVWATVVILMGMALMYKSVLAMNEIAYLFWFYSGVVARNAYLERQARRKRSVADEAAKPVGSPVPSGKLGLQWSHQGAR